MILAYDEIIDFIAAGSEPVDVVQFRPSEEACAQVAELLQREKSGELPAGEHEDLLRYLELEHLMRLAKARARERLAGAAGVAP